MRHNGKLASDPGRALGRSAAILQCLAAELRDFAAGLPTPAPALEALSLDAERLAARLIVRRGTGRLPWRAGETTRRPWA